MCSFTNIIWTDNGTTVAPLWGQKLPKAGRLRRPHCVEHSIHNVRQQWSAYDPSAPSMPPPPRHNDRYRACRNTVAPDGSFLVSAVPDAASFVPASPPSSGELPHHHPEYINSCQYPQRPLHPRFYPCLNEWLYPPKAAASLPGDIWCLDAQTCSHRITP